MKLVHPERLAPHPLHHDTRQVRRAQGSERIEIQIQARPLAPVAAESPAGHLTREEYADLFGLPAEELAALVDFYTTQGLELLEACAASHVVVLSGSIEQVESVFGIELWLCETRGQEHLCTTDTPGLPPAIADQVAGVHGFDHRPICDVRSPRPVQKGQADATEVTGSAPQAESSTADAAGEDAGPPYSPLQIAELYDFPAHSGVGQHVSILEFGGGFKTAILEQYFRKTLGSSGPTFNEVPVLKAKNDPTSYGSVEVMLDLEIIGALIPEATFTVYFAPNSLDSWPEVMRQAVHATPTPDVISVSWGQVEAHWSSTAVTSMEKHLETAKTLGITVCFSAGDDGVQPVDGAVQVQYPASSSHVLSCGGTVFLAKQGEISIEVVWESSSQATGGGISNLFAEVPPWQLAAKPGTNLTTGKAGRGVPDVSAVASDLCAYNILLNDGTWKVVCGTSAVSPLWAALVARMNGLLGSRLGFVNPRLYQVTSAFRDIVKGSNTIASIKGYSASVGWDACTGLGTPKGKALLEALRAGPVASGPAASGESA